MTAAKKTNGKPQEQSTEELATTQEQSTEELAARRASARFLAEVERQFVAEMGSGLSFTDLEKRLAQHMYLGVDQALKTAEARRKNGAEITWHTIDRQKLALDTVHRVSLGLDALIPNHIWPIVYWNSHKNAYDVDLRVGYVGRDYVARKHALETPVDVIYELVYSTDKFVAFPRSAARDIEAYDFEISSPFDRGEIVGGFGYIVYDDPRKNRLVLVTQRDFKRSRGASKSNFWGDHSVEMHFKTVVHRVTSKIPMDPEKVNAAAFSALLEEDREPVEVAHQNVQIETERYANQQTIDVQPIEAADDDEQLDDVEVQEESDGRLFEKPAARSAVQPPF